MEPELKECIHITSGTQVLQSNKHARSAPLLHRVLYIMPTAVFYLPKPHLLSCKTKYTCVVCLLKPIALNNSAMETSKYPLHKYITHLHVGFKNRTRSPLLGCLATSDSLYKCWFWCTCTCNYTSGVNIVNNNVCYCRRLIGLSATLPSKNDRSYSFHTCMLTGSCFNTVS